MPQLVFDPDGNYDTCSISKRNRLYGGGLTGAKRCEYVRLCKLITSRDPSQDYDGIRDAILAIMKEDVTEHIMTLPEAVREVLLTDIETFFSTIDFSDNPLSIINIVGLQIAILFTKYVDPKNNASQEPYNPENPSLEFYTSITKDNQWKTYSEIKTQIIGDFSVLLSNDNPRDSTTPQNPTFMVFVGFTTLGELMESYFNNVFYLGLIYKRDYVDGILYNPLEVIGHDYGHYLDYKICLKNPLTMNKIKEFHTYIVSTKDKSVQYAINFSFFFLIHENNCLSFQTVIGKIFKNNLNKTYNYKEYKNHVSRKLLELNSEIFNYLDKEIIKKSIMTWQYEICDLSALGMAVPKAYRILKEGSTNNLEPDKVFEYVDLVVSLFDECYKEFLGLKKGGRRKRLTRKRRVNRKQRKTRQRSY